MAELSNCARCGEIFVKKLHDICQSCQKELEQAYQVVYQYLNNREHREATITEIAEATGIKKEMIISFIREGRLRPSQYPKLAYPCDRCGADITKGRLCADCAEELKTDLERYEKWKQKRQPQIKEYDRTYYAVNKHKK